VQSTVTSRHRWRRIESIDFSKTMLYSVQSEVSAKKFIGGTGKIMCWSKPRNIPHHEDLDQQFNTLTLHQNTPTTGKSMLLSVHHQPLFGFGRDVEFRLKFLYC
jgi:hypothetical protein